MTIAEQNVEIIVRPSFRTESGIERLQYILAPRNAFGGDKAMSVKVTDQDGHDVHDIPLELVKAHTKVLEYFEGK